MAEQIISEEYYIDQQPICPDRDWQCMLQNFYQGYLIFVEVVVQNGVDEEGNPIYEVNGVEVTDMTNQEIEDIINGMKVIYPSAIECRVHFCGNHIGKPCKLIRV